MLLLPFFLTMCNFCRWVCSACVCHQNTGLLKYLFPVWLHGVQVSQIFPLFFKLPQKRGKKGFGVQTCHPYSFLEMFSNIDCKDFFRKWWNVCIYREVCCCSSWAILVYKCHIQVSPFVGLILSLFLKVDSNFTTAVSLPLLLFLFLSVFSALQVILWTSIMRLQFPLEV